jgi:hypothetical protein
MKICVRSGIAFIVLYTDPYLVLPHHMKLLLADHTYNTDTTDQHGIDASLTDTTDP